MASTGQPYSNRSCTVGCTSFDQHYTKCLGSASNFGFTRCVCTPTFTQTLYTCTVCDAENLGGNALLFYQDWTVACYAQTYQSLTLPESFVDYDPGNGFAQIFSSSILPQIRTASAPSGTLVVVTETFSDTATPPAMSTPTPTAFPSGSTSENSMATGVTSPGGAMSSPTLAPLSSSTAQVAAPTSSSGFAGAVAQSQPATQHLALLAALGALLGLV